MSCGSEHVTLHVPSTAETKDLINEELLMKMPKDCTLINAARPESVHEARETRTFVTSPMRRPRMPRKPRRPSATSPRSASFSPRGRETQADNRIISIREHRTALRRLQGLQAVFEERGAVTGLSSTGRCTACTAASASCRTGPAEARSDGEDRSLASGLCPRIGRASPAAMGPQYRRLAIHDSWTHLLEPRTAREAKV